MTFADVILPLPLTESLTYSVPPEYQDMVKVGCRVIVPLGKSKHYTGIIVRIHGDEPHGYTVKDITQLLDTAPVVTDEQMTFWKWIAGYYLCSVGEVFNAAMPAKMKPKEKTKRQRKKQDTAQATLPGISDTYHTHTIHSLSQAQKNAYDEILSSFHDHDVTLLHGVTSSGKTEIYIQLIRHYLSLGKNVLYLLPEIALTTQITDRLRAVFADQLGVYHSKFTDRERAEVYQRQLSEQPYRVLLGVRSSIFLPTKDLGLVIIDEEHETSYKQQDPAPRYHARSGAIMLAHAHGAKTLLGTATPSIESYFHAQKGRYGYVTLTQRYSGLQLPEIEIVDIKRLRQTKRMKMRDLFSPPLIDTVREALGRNEQVILFHNRRGFSNFIECKNCGWVPHCDHCDVSLTYHKRTESLSCHYCGKTYLLPLQCPDCGEKDFIDKGAGTEKIEDQIGKYFPEARILRMDLDTARTKAQHEEIIHRFQNHESDILIGTQMVSKGLDFDRVSVVGVLDADTMLNMPDFRSHERTFQMLAQVAGRAGRKGHRGKVIIQTRSADSEIIRNVTEDNYAAMYAGQTEERLLFRYPPFSRLIYVYLKHRDSTRLDMMAGMMASVLKDVFGNRVLGPDRPVISRVSSLCIRKIIIKMEPEASVSKVRDILRQCQNYVLTQPDGSGLTIYYDVDPG